MKKKIALITTGGTIASTRNEAQLLESGKLDGKEILSMCQLENELEIELIDIFQIPSMHVTFDHLNTLQQQIESLFTDPTISGVVITHGTDSLEETAYFLDLTINDPRPIIVTGSQKAPSDIGTDVYANLRNALLVASNDNANNIGTSVVFNGKIFHAKYVKKVHTMSIDGFGTIGYGMLGHIDNDEVIIYQKPVNKEHYNIAKQYPYVEIIDSYLGAPETLLELLSKTNVEGIVLVGAGRGQISPNHAKQIEQLIKKDVKVVLTTSADEGRVFTTYDYYGSANYLEKLGVIMGGDFQPKKARIKLMLMIANRIEDYTSFMQ